MAKTKKDTSKDKYWPRKEAISVGFMTYRRTLVFWAAVFFLVFSVYCFLSVVSPYLPISPSPHYLLAVSGHFVLLV